MEHLESKFEEFVKEIDGDFCEHCSSLLDDGELEIVNSILSEWLENRKDFKKQFTKILKILENYKIISDKTDKEIEGTDILGEVVGSGVDFNYTIRQNNTYALLTSESNTPSISGISMLFEK